MIVVRSFSNSPAYNLAFEEFLFSEFQDDFLLFYGNKPCVVIGSNQAVKNEVDMAYCSENEIQILRRKSGGGAVFHDLGNLNFSFITQRTEKNNGTTADFLQPIIALLKNQNVNANIGQRKDLWLPNACKISGTASYVKRNRVMQHGTLLLKTDLEKLQYSLQVQNKNLQIRATASVPSTTTNVLDYLALQSACELTVQDFVEKLLTDACLLYNSVLMTEADYDQDAIKTYLGLYESKEWIMKK